MFDTEICEAEDSGITALRPSFQNQHYLLEVLCGGAKITVDIPANRISGDREMGNGFRRSKKVAALFLLCPLALFIAIGQSDLALGQSATPARPIANNEQDQLIRAIRQGHLSEVKQLLAAGTDPNSRSNDGDTALILAVDLPYPQHLDIVNALLDARADVNAKGRDGGTALMMAAGMCDAQCDAIEMEVVKVLLARGADVNAADANGVTALMRASGVQVTEVLVGKGANIDARDGIHGWTPLMWAASHSRPEVVKTMIAEGADVNARAKNGDSALMVVSKYRGGGEESWSDVAEVLRLLIEKGANVNAKGADGSTALIYAAQYGKYLGTPYLQVAFDDWNASRMVQTLLNHGADVNARANDGTTPLMAACRRVYPSTVQVLLNSRADVNATKNDGSTALMEAAARRFSEIPPSKYEEQTERINIARALLEHGADANPKNKFGESAIYVAYSNGFDDLLKELLSKNNILEADEGVSAPQVTQSVKPKYIPEDRILLHGGATVTIKVWLIVDAQGVPKEVHIGTNYIDDLEPHGLDKRVIEAVKQYRFRPTTYQGHPAAVLTQIDVDLHLH